MWAKASIFRIGPFCPDPTVCHDAEVPRRAVDREALVGAAIAGAAAGAASGPRQAVEASTGLIAAASLFAAGAWGLLASLPFDPPPTA
jgi:hypothetical protein